MEIAQPHYKLSTDRSRNGCQPIADSIIGLWSLTDSSGSCASSSASGSPPLDDDPPFEIPAPVVKAPVKKIRNVRKSPIHKCAVCGDRPTGYHYDVLSCNGCKTFFRRTVINRRRFVCSRGGNCEFTKDFRCACRACRFSKCVAAGMNPKAIQFPASSAIVEKEEIDSDEHETGQQAKDMSLVPLLQTVKTEDVDHMMALDMIVHRELAVKNLRGQEFPFSIYPDVPLEDLIDFPCRLGQYGHKIEIQDTQVSAPVEMYKKNPVRFWMVADLYLTVEFAKTFMDFQTLTKQDKFEIMYKVGGCVQIITQSYYSAQEHCDSLVFPDGINALYYQVVKNNRRQYELYYRECYCRPVDVIRRLQLSMPEFVMFKTIALFSSEVDCCQESQRAIKEKREHLVSIFRKYLISQYGMQRGTEKLGLCLVTIATFIDIAEKRRSYLHCIDLMDKCQISKLAKGIYLKQPIH